MGATLTGKGVRLEVVVWGGEKVRGKLVQKCRRKQNWDRCSK